jgi:hypothetical protein
MVRPYPHERREQLRSEGKRTLEINAIMRREHLEYAIADIEDISDVRRVLFDILEHVRIT